MKTQRVVVILSFVIIIFVIYRKCIILTEDIV